MASENANPCCESETESAEPCRVVKSADPILETVIAASGAEAHQLDPVSQRKLKANQENAKKSTGPRTARGKARSRRNALKHGLFTRHSMEFFLLGEDSSEYDEHLDDLLEQYQPIGRAEELEVERIAVCWWRLKRAWRYEIAAIRVAVRDAGRKELARQAEHCKSLDEMDEPLLSVLRSIQDEIDATDEVPKDFKQKIFAVRPGFESVWPLIEASAQDMLKRIIPRNMFEKASPEELAVDSAWFTMTCAIVFIEQSSQFRTTNIPEIAVAEHVIPRGESLDRLLRYETKIDRDLSRSLDRLERLQRRRLGESLPPPVSVRLTR